MVKLRGIGHLSQEAESSTVYLKHMWPEASFVILLNSMNEDLNCDYIWSNLSEWELNLPEFSDIKASQFNRQ